MAKSKTSNEKMVMYFALFICNEAFCFSPSLRDNLKVGNGQACRQKHGNDALTVEVVIIISDNELLGPSNSSPSCLKAFESKTEVRSLW